MKYISTLLAALLVVGSLAVLPIYAEEREMEETSTVSPLEWRMKQ